MSCSHNTTIVQELEKIYKIKQSIEYALLVSTRQGKKAVAYRFIQYAFIAYVVAATSCLPQDFIVIKRVVSSKSKPFTVCMLIVDKRKVGNKKLKSPMVETAFFSY